MSVQPYDFPRAHAASAEASRAQEATEDFIKQASRDFALAEEAYRKALADKILELRADGLAATACGDVARGDKHVAELRRKRDIADGVREAAVQAAWRRSADRRDTERFIEWSMRRELAEGFGRTVEPPASTPIGSRRAA